MKVARGRPPPGPPFAQSGNTTELGKCGATPEGLPNRVGRPALGPKPQNPSLLLAGPGPARPSPTPHFYRRAWAGPAPQIPHFYRRASGPPSPPKSLTFIDGARPPQTPHFY